MPYNFDTLVNRRDSECAKWGMVEQDVLPMWVADMDFKSPQPIINALMDRVEHGVFGYALPPDGLKKAVMDWLSDRHGWNISMEDIILIPGVVPGFNLAAHAVTRPGDGILFHTPAYGPFFNVSKNADLIEQVMPLNLCENGQYTIDFDEFEARLTGRSRVFLLCNPQNPSGRVFHQDELEKMAEICLRNNIIICSDEIHSDLVFEGSKHIPIASLAPEISSNTITLLAPSKTFNIAGLHVSIAIITEEELRKTFEGARKGLLSGVDLLGQYAMKAAYLNGKDWLEALLVYLESNRDFLVDYVNHQLSGIKIAQSEGTFLGWLDCRELQIDKKPSEFFVEEAKVRMNDGEWFGENGKGFVRLNFGCPRSMLVEALERIKEALSRLEG
jgi:cystathionine beta-lyase